MINGLQNSLAIAVESGRDSIRKPLFTKRHSQPRSRGVGVEVMVEENGGSPW